VGGTWDGDWQNNPHTYIYPPNFALYKWGRCAASQIHASRPSQPSHSLQVFWIPVSLHRDFRGCGVDLAQIICGEFDC
jgi:hypothetical protein